MDIAILLSIPFWVLWAIGVACWIIFMVKDHKHNKVKIGAPFDDDYRGDVARWVSDRDAWWAKRKRIRRWHTAFYVFLLTAIVIQFIKIAFITA